jgi:ferric-dicitrate binding protein FerR (iron transport regulator)
MRRNRGALWALGMAGAAYLWRNRARLRGQLNSLQNSQGRRTPMQLPDNSPRMDEPTRRNDYERPRDTQFGGSEV